MTRDELHRRLVGHTIVDVNDSTLYGTLNRYGSVVLYLDNGTRIELEAHIAYDRPEDGGPYISAEAS